MSRLGASPGFFNLLEPWLAPKRLILVGSMLARRRRILATEPILCQPRCRTCDVSISVRPPVLLLSAAMITETTQISNARSSHRTTRATPGLIVSLDFELRWGVRDLPNEIAYRDHLLAAREAIPATLRMFKEYDIHATWATVGMLFFDSKKELLKQLPEIRPTYDNPGLSPYDDLDSIGADEKSDPLHFGRSLVAQICATPGQEIASHTFCHYYCLEPGQTTEQFRVDLEKSISVSRAMSGESPRSIVFPRNHCSAAHIEVCEQLGVDVYRGTESHWAYHAKTGAGFNTLPRRLTRLADSFLPITGSQSIMAETKAGQGKVCNVPSSRFLRPRYQGIMEHIRTRRITSAMRSAITSGDGFHLWWHPHNFGDDIAGNLESLEQVLKAFCSLRDAGIGASYTMSEYADAACL